MPNTAEKIGTESIPSQLQEIVEVLDVDIRDVRTPIRSQVIFALQQSELRKFYEFCAKNTIDTDPHEDLQYALKRYISYEYKYENFICDILTVSVDMKNKIICLQISL